MRPRVAGGRPEFNVTVDLNDLVRIAVENERGLIERRVLDAMSTIQAPDAGYDYEAKQRLLNRLKDVITTALAGGAK